MEYECIYHYPLSSGFNQQLDFLLRGQLWLVPN